jgi:hypothetical protein
MILYGIAIADPAQSNMRLGNKQSNDGFNIERKKPGLPLAPFASEQTRLRRFPEDELPSPTGIPTTDVSTIPVTEDKNLSELDLWRQRRSNLWAVVEIPLLEASKQVLVNSGGVFFNPMKAYPTPTFKEVLR